MENLALKTNRPMWVFRGWVEPLLLLQGMGWALPTVTADGLSPPHCTGGGFSPLPTAPITCLFLPTRLHDINHSCSQPFVCSLLKTITNVSSRGYFFSTIFREQKAVYVCYLLECWYYSVLYWWQTWPASTRRCRMSWLYAHSSWRLTSHEHAPNSVLPASIDFIFII